MDVPEPLIIGVVVLVVGSVAASFVDRLGAPTLLVFLGLGMLLGEDGPGGVHFDDAVLARDAGLVALAAILFEGGVLADLPEVRLVRAPAVALASVGVVVTGLVVGVVTRVAVGFGWATSLLLGAAVSSTDAAAVFSAIRGANLRRRLASILEAESGLNDPFAAVLVIGLVDWQTHAHFGVSDAAILLAQESLIGAAGGVAVGLIAAALLRRLPLPSAGLAPVVAIGVALAGYVGVSLAGGSGLLTVYLAGLIVGEARIPHAGVVRGFLQGTAWLAQLGLFVLLGLLVTPSRLLDEGLSPLVVAVALVVLARPLAVALCTTPFGLGLREQGFLAWAGLRGGVPIVLATFPIAAGVSGSSRIFNVVFYVVVVSVVVQGITVRWMARRLGVLETHRVLDMADLDAATLQTLGADLIELQPADLAIEPGTAVRDLRLPGAAVIVAVRRGDQLVLPRGGTLVENGDRMYLLVERRRLQDVHTAIRRVDQAAASANERMSG
jgi:cell volume regulation protein A